VLKKVKSESNNLFDQLPERDRKAREIAMAIKEERDSFNRQKAPLLLKYAAEKELNVEKEEYFVIRKLTNKIADLGYVPYESNNQNIQKFVKVENDMLIQLLFRMKKRRDDPPEATDHEAEHIKAVDQISQHVSHLEMRQPTFKDESIPINDQSGRDYYEGKVEPKEDSGRFIIILVDKFKKAVRFDCTYSKNEVVILSVTFSPDASKFESPNLFECQKDREYSAKFDNLSTRLQKRFVEYLYSMGIPPDIGSIAEFVSINKEQRLYMNWLKDFQENSDKI